MSIDKSKTDTILGAEVYAHLKSKGLNTPTIDNGLTTEEKLEKIEYHFSEIMKTLGLDLTDDSLSETPSRIAKMYVKETCLSLTPEAFPKCTTVENKMGRKKDFVLERNITFSALCEHHFLPLIGKCTIAYIPKNRVLGLSKFHRVVRALSGPTIQERTTAQIHAALCYILDTNDVVVYVDAAHTCVSTRGIRDVTSSTVTLVATGAFEDNDVLRGEFLAEARKS